VAQEYLKTELSEDEFKDFEAALASMYDSKGNADHWWFEFLKAIRRRREAFQEQLAEGLPNQREEDRLRGRINECAFIIALDVVGRQTKEARDGSRRKQA